MMSRAVGIRCGCCLAAALVMEQAVQAQWCPNNPAVVLTDSCLGQNSLLFTVPAGGADTTAGIEDTAFGNGTLVYNTTGSFDTAVGSNALTFNTTGKNNTAVGSAALGQNVTGSGNTAVGMKALWVSYAGSANTAVGFQALLSDATGGWNTATGAEALYYNQSGGFNSAFGMGALFANVSGGSNTAVGSSALQNLSSGSLNLALGLNAGLAYSGGESNNIVLASNGVAGESGVTRIGSNGTQTRAFVAGIHGATSSGGNWVLVNSAGQLGTVTSSLRFKGDVADMGEASADLMRLRPVSFLYKPQYDDGQRLLQYGLIAEEVALVNPGLVQFGDDGKPLTVRYHFVSAMLLNEVQRQQREIAELRAKIAEQKQQAADQEARIKRLEADFGRQ